MLDPDSSTAGAPLQQLSPDKVNQQRDSCLSAFNRPDLGGNTRDSFVHDKINQFNTLSTQSRQLERKTADAALRRAMVGREEAEAEMRRYREESRLLRQQLDEGRERERKVGERLEVVIENYGRAKETYSHTQALWEKEIRRARKEAFKCQSNIVKLQEELKSARSALHTTEDSLEREKEKNKMREQEAFAARYQLVGAQEQLEKTQEEIKCLVQERDAFKALAKQEEVARIAAEGRLPLPPSASADDEFASPKKSPQEPTILTTEIQCSATSEAEIERLTEMLAWERHRAIRAIQEVDFLKTECELVQCPGAKALKAKYSASAPLKPLVAALEVVDPADMAILGISNMPTPLPKQRASNRSIPAKPKIRDSRRSTIFIPSEGTFRTVSQQEAEVLLAAEANAPAEKAPSPAPVTSKPEPCAYARTPSADPPTFALLGQERASLQSLLDAPHQGDCEVAPHQLPLTSAEQSHKTEADSTSPAFAAIERSLQKPACEHNEDLYPTAPIDCADDSTAYAESEMDEATPKSDPRPPQTSTPFYSTVTQTTSIPLKETGTNTLMSQRLQTPKSGTFDVNNPALTPTMTREQALAQIRERRGRARSLANGTMTPRRQMFEGVGERRDVSAPVTSTTASKARP